MIRDAISHFGGDSTLGTKIVAGTVTEPDFLEQVGEQVVARVQAQYQNGVRKRYQKLLRDWSSSELAYYFHPA
jgi:hypothetical protein